MIERSGNRLVVSAPMTIANARALSDKFTAFAQEGEVVVDLAQVREADSASLALLFDWVRAQQARGGSLRVENAPRGVMALAAMYDVADLIALSPAA